jgi:hypothetical protein
MKFLFRIFLICILSIICKLSSFSQKYICDSLQISFGIVSNPKTPLLIDSVIDSRDILTGTQIRISERKKYVYIPVDFYYVTKHPLTKEIALLFTDSLASDTAFKLVIERFELNYRESFKPVTQLIAQIKVYSGIKSTQKKLLGTLAYEIVGDKPKKGKEQESFEILITRWVANFQTDIVKLKHGAGAQRSTGFCNYFPPDTKTGQSIYTEASVLFGIQSYIIDGDLGFYDPEATPRVFRRTSFIRYRNEKRYESIAFGSRSYHFYYRLNDKFMADVGQRVCVGLNRWKDMDTYDHKLYDIVHIDVGLKAGIYYYPFGKRSVVAGLVTTHDLIYVYCMGSYYLPAIGMVVGINF